jgi:LAO/AO transport system kinase
MSLVDSVLAGNRLALARLLTQVENGTLEGRAALNELFPYTGKAQLIGVTGAPGTGKSSLVSQLVRSCRRSTDGRLAGNIAVIAVDPSSPFSGGAVLGDRVRMRDLAGDSGVFIRSMASRGALGGLAYTTAAVAQVFDAAGYDQIIIETVGSGQSEVEIARLAHTTIVVEAPGLGDDIQAIKAGILEIADVLVINKADQPGAENSERVLRSMLELTGSFSQSDKDEKPAQWFPPIIMTVATEGVGIETLIEAIQKHENYLRQSGKWKSHERFRLKSELDMLLKDTLVSHWRANVVERVYEDVLDKLVERQISPSEAVHYLLKGVAL